MWQLNLHRLETLVGPLGQIAIETGTCRGNGTRILAKAFSQVISIELSEALADAARAKLSGFAHVEVITGSSSLELPSVLKKIPIEESVFFFLDAHWSGDQSVSWAPGGWQGYGIDTAHRGQADQKPTPEEQCPLAAELAIIMKHWPGQAYVLIDDMKNIPATGPGLKNGTFPGEDWSHLSRELLLSLVRPRLAELHELDQPEQWFLALRPDSFRK